MKRDFLRLQRETFDLLVCGGGVYGAWVAYDAALRGLRVAIVEQDDWGGATSSASSKLIHGGLRYLESFEFGLVRKSLAEREMLLKVAPHRVWPLRFGVPVYGDSRVGALRLKAGLSLYDLLAGNFSSRQAHRHFRRDQFLERFPLLNAAGLKSGFSYADAQTDDARLVLELIDGAMSYGAICVSHCRLQSFIEKNGRASGAVVRDRLTGGEVDIGAGQIVSTTGHWLTEKYSGSCRLSKGVHLVLPDAGIADALLLTAPSDGRVFFIIPWYGRTLLGTTDTDYSGDLNRVAAEESDIAYLLSSANHYLRTSWSKKDVVGCYAGLRALKHEAVASPSALSREWQMETAANGVHYSIGGKLTAAREDAASITDVVCRQLGIKAQCATQGRLFPWAPDQERFDEIITSAQQAGADLECATWLVRRHGKRAAAIVRTMKDEPPLARRIVSELPLIYADLLFCARNEMVVHLDDLLRRRVPLLILARLDAAELRRLAGLVAPGLGWDEVAIEQEVRACLDKRQG